MTVQILLASFAGFLLYYVLIKRHPDKTLGIYSNGGKYFWLKYWTIYLILGLRKRKLQQQRIRNENDDGCTDNQKSFADLEAKRLGPITGARLPDGCERAVDAVYFNAANSDGYYFAVGTAQRPNSIMNAFFVLKIPGLGLLQNIEMPTTNLPSDDVPGAYSTKGILIKCLEPMKKWQITYHGLLQRDGDKRSIVKGTIKFVWTATSPWFNFDTDTSSQCVARSLARETWSRAMFNKLKQAHQTHHEQFGELQGSVDLDGFDTGHVTMTSMRDHTVGKHRNWSELRRYIMTIFHLVDGTCIHTGVISMPAVVFTQLEVGYMVTKDKQVIPVDRIDLNLWQLGEDGKIPNEFGYTFTAGGNKYTVDVTMVDKTVQFPMGLDERATVHENMAEFTCNGVKGYGITEWEYCKDN